MRDRPRPWPLPVSLQEARRRGIEEFDVIQVTGDAYVDHPSFGTAVRGRILQDAGRSAGIIFLPDRNSDADFKRPSQAV